MALRRHREPRKHWPASHRCPSVLGSSWASEKRRWELDPRVCATIDGHEDPPAQCSSTLTPIPRDALFAELSGAKPRQPTLSRIPRLAARSSCDRRPSSLIFYSASVP